MAKRFLTSLGLLVLPSDPPNGSDGQMYFNSYINKVKVYFNGTWNEISGGGGGSSVDEIYYSTNPPSNPQEGDIWIDSDSFIETIFYLPILYGGLVSTTYFENYADSTGPGTTVFENSYDGGTL